MKEKITIAIIIASVIALIAGVVIKNDLLVMAGYLIGIIFIDVEILLRISQKK